MAEKEKTINIKKCHAHIVGMPRARNHLRSNPEHVSHRRARSDGWRELALELVYAYLTFNTRCLCRRPGRISVIQDEIMYNFTDSSKAEYARSHIGRKAEWGKELPVFFLFFKLNIYDTDKNHVRIKEKTAVGWFSCKNWTVASWFVCFLFQETLQKCMSLPIRNFWKLRC